MDNYGYQPEESNNGGPFAIARYSSSQVAPYEYRLPSKSKPQFQEHTRFYKRLSLILFILVILFLIGLIVLLFLYIKIKPKICTTNECLRSASNLKYSLDLTVNPCDNFYQYCCGKWSEEHPNHGWYSSFSTFATISEKILLESIGILKSESKENEPKAVQEARDFYKSCMNTDVLNNLGLTVLFKYLKMVNLPLVPRYLSESGDTFNFNWLNAEAQVKQTFSMDVFIGFTVDPNTYNRTQNVIYIGIPYQNCPLPSPLKRRNKLKLAKEEEDDEDEEAKEELIDEIRGNIIKFVVKEVMKNLTIPEPDEKKLNEAAKIINEIGSYVEDLSTNYTILLRNQEVDDAQPISFADFQSKTDDFLQKPYPDLWINYMNHIFDSTNVTIDPGTDMLYITKTEEMYLLKILSYVFSNSEVNIELYIWWVTVYAMIINTSPDIVEYISSQTYSYYESDNNEVLVHSRSLDCSSLVISYMGLAVSYAIADKSFSNSTKPKVENMIKGIKDAFVDHVRGINWMDEYTKKVTLEKSREMKSFVGYPDWLFEDGALDEYYKGLEVKPDTFLENMMMIIISHTNKTLTSLRIEHKRDWMSEPIDVNAFNSFSDNAINVPMAILNFPIYNLGLEVLNYGSIGAILGHELTHGFDNTGRKHDKFGNYVQWWSNKTIEKFENLTQCFVKQYDNYTIEGIDGHINGKNTLGENLADNGGLNQAFAAYKRFVRKNGEEPKLPGFENFTSFQLFFTAYGNLWCETSTLEDLQNQIEQDEHCPNAIRVIGTLQNSDEFAEEFKCPKGSFMNPDRNKCKIW